MTFDAEKEIKLLKQHYAALSDQLAEMRKQIDKLYEYDAERTSKEYLEKDAGGKVDKK